MVKIPPKPVVKQPLPDKPREVVKNPPKQIETTKPSFIQEKPVVKPVPDKPRQSENKLKPKDKIIIAPSVPSNTIHQDGGTIKPSKTEEGDTETITTPEIDNSEETNASSDPPSPVQELPIRPRKPEKGDF